MPLPRRRIVLILAAGAALPDGAAVAVSAAHQGAATSAAPHRSPTVPPHGLPGLVERITPAGTYFSLTDSQGSVLAIVNSSGAVVQNYAYDVFGAVTSQSGGLGSEPQFAGQETDPDGLQ
ncbi:MAG TPA: hypothetical protein VKV26_18500 [Dehalococcoidia bacterium]|nr:hypothetical protein [Dehalococcoidia bacterium]